METSLEKLVDKTLETKTKELLPKILSVMEALQQQSTSSETSCNSLPTNCSMLQLAPTTSSLAAVPNATMTAATIATSFELPMDLLELASSSSAMSHGVRRDGQKSAKSKLRVTAEGGSNRDTSRVKPASSSKLVSQKKEDFSQKQAGGEAGKLLQSKEVRTAKDQKGAGRAAAPSQEEGKAIEVKSSIDNSSSREAHEEQKEARQTKGDLADKGVNSMSRPEQSQHSVSLEPTPDQPPVTAIRDSGPASLSNQDNVERERKRRLSSSSNECQRQEWEEQVWDGGGEGAVAPPKSKRQKKLLHRRLPRIPLRNRRAIVSSSSSGAEGSDHEQHIQEENDGNKEQSALKGSQMLHRKRCKLDARDPASSELQGTTMDESLAAEVDATPQDKNPVLVKMEGRSVSVVVTRYNRTVKPNRRYTPSDHQSDSEQEVETQPVKEAAEEAKESVKVVVEKKSTSKNYKRRRRK